MNIRSIVEFFISVLFLGFILCASLSCQDKYLTVERRVIDSENKIPIYFNTYAEQDGLNTWRPVFTYYIYQMEEYFAKQDSAKKAEAKKGPSY